MLQPLRFPDRNTFCQSLLSAFVASTYCELLIVNHFHIFLIINMTRILEILETNCFYILSGFIAVVTYILNGPRNALTSVCAGDLFNAAPEVISEVIRVDPYQGYRRVLLFNWTRADIFLHNGYAYLTRGVQYILP